jgi:transposase
VPTVRFFPKEALMACTIPPTSWQVNATDPLALTRVLGLPEFVVTALEYDERLDCVVVRCDHVRDTARCPGCGTWSPHPHQYESRAVRDLALAGRRCSLEFASRRFKCTHCRRPFTEVLEAVAPQARRTRRYEVYLFDQCRSSTLQDVARRERLGYKTVEGLYYRQAAQQELTIDEIALKKGRGQYALVLSDVDGGRVLTVLPERTKEALEAHFASWSAEQRAAVTDVALDLWEPYHLAVTAKLPNARITGDRFHVMKNLNERVTEARRVLQRAASAADQQRLKGCRWLLVKNQADLDERERAKLAELYLAAPLLGRLHQLKEAFRTICETAPDRATAAARLTAWIAEVEASGVPSLTKFVRTLRRWWDAILNYFHERLTSGVVEGLNNKLKLIKRRAFGYRNFTHFRLRVLVECQGHREAH